MVHNIAGTTSQSFMIGKRGIQIHYGSVEPTIGIGNNGDLYVYKSQKPTVYQKVNDEWYKIGAKRLIEVNASSFNYLNIHPEEVLLVDTSTSATTITLDSAGLNAGHTVRIKDKTGNSNTYNITVNTEGSETIDGGSSFVINTSFTSITFVTDGSNWYVI